MHIHGMQMQFFAADNQAARLDAAAAERAAEVRRRLLKASADEATFGSWGEESSGRQGQRESQGRNARQESDREDDKPDAPVSFWA